MHPARRASGRGRGAAGRGPPPAVSRFRSEIAEQPEVAEGRGAEGRQDAASSGDSIRSAAPRGFTIAARGSSDNAALYAKYLFGVRNRALVALAAPSLFTHYAHPPSLEGQCVVGISHSGESPDVIAVGEEARRKGTLTAASTNESRSTLAQAAELGIAITSRHESSVPASQTNIALLLGLALVSQ